MSHLISFNLKVPVMPIWEIGRIIVATFLTFLWLQDLPQAVSADELARCLDLKKLEERVHMFEAVSAYDG